MDVVKAVVASVVGALVGGAAAVLLVTTCTYTVGMPDDVGVAFSIGGFSVIGGILGGAVLGGYLYRLQEQKGAPMLTPDAEKKARAKFMPSSDTAADDPSIQPDKRGFKPGDS